MTFYGTKSSSTGDIICHPITERNLISLLFSRLGDTLFRILEGSSVPRHQLQWRRQRADLHPEPRARRCRTLPTAVGHHRDKAPPEHVYVSREHGSQINFPRCEVSDKKDER